MQRVSAYAHDLLSEKIRKRTPDVSTSEPFVITVPLGKSFAVLPADVVDLGIGNLARGLSKSRRISRERQRV